MSHDPLFDRDGYKQPRPERKADDSALDLDREASFRRDHDGRLAREVAMHSLDKAHYAHYYADIVGRAMQNAYPGPLAWIELFAGPGRLYVKDLAQFRDGSPVEAVEGIKKPFNTYVFSDLDPRCVQALQDRLGHRPDVHVLEGDCNSAALHDQIVALVPKNALTILYADPAGLHLHFDTLKFFAERYKHLDLLINFPVPGVDRALSAGHDEKASRVLNHPAPIQLLASPNARTSVRQWFERQLGSLGYTEFCSKTINHASKRSPLYDLMLASRNPRAKEFFEEAIRHPLGGQRPLEMF
jgi:three-Cys-motif partner protein